MHPYIEYRCNLEPSRRPIRHKVLDLEFGRGPRDPVGVIVPGSDGPMGLVLDPSNRRVWHAFPDKTPVLVGIYGQVFGAGVIGGEA